MKSMWMPLAAIFFTVRKSSCGKVMFSQVSAILSTGGSSRHPLGRHPPGQTLPLGRHSPHPPRQPLQRTVCILLECILVMTYFYRAGGMAPLDPLLDPLLDLVFLSHDLLSDK